MIIEILIVIAIELIIYGYLFFANGPGQDRRSAAEELDHEWRATRRAMNDAASQSWRNLAD